MKIKHKFEDTVHEFEYEEWQEEIIKTPKGSFNIDGQYTEEVVKTGKAVTCPICNKLVKIK